jgi:predicted DNA-binding transcriptional regulator AlpA
MKHPIDNLITPEQVATMAGVSYQTICNWRRAGLLPSPVIASERCVRWERRDIEKWMMTNKQRGEKMADDTRLREYKAAQKKQKQMQTVEDTIAYLERNIAKWNAERVIAAKSTNQLDAERMLVDAIALRTQLRSGK